MNMIHTHLCFNKLRLCIETDIGTQYIEHDET